MGKSYISIWGFFAGKRFIKYRKKIALDERFKNKPNEFASTQNWNPYIIKCDKEYAFIKSGNDFNKTTKGIIREDEEVLAITSDGLQNKEWIEIYFPKKGFIYSNELSLFMSNHLLGIGISYGFLKYSLWKKLREL